MKFLSEIHRREFTSRRASFRLNSTGLRSYQLSRILPRSALEDVFLGFSVCGQFLVSYKMDFKRFLLRFWFFPPEFSPDSNEAKLQLFAEAPFFHITYVSRFQDTPCVRFIQSTLDFTTFLLLSCDCNGNGLVTAYGSMPNVDCEACMHAHLNLNGSPAAGDKASPSCPVHLQVLLLNLDLPIMADRTPCAFDLSADRDSTIRSAETFRSRYKSVRPARDYIPPCLRTYGLAQHCTGWMGSEADRHEVSTGCTCFASTPWPIGAIQVSVCARTGALRLAWASPDAQIKVISCVFETEKQSPTTMPHVRVYPQGTAVHACGHAAPMAFKAPLLTQNYCSRCYSWPARDCGPCRSSKAFALAPGRLVPTECIFRQNPSSVYIVDDSDNWPDNHKQPELPLYDSRHECIQPTPSYPWGHKSSTQFLSNASSKSLPAFLFHRPVFTCCLPLTYLAMLEDIRASYIHWTLVSRTPCSSTAITTTSSNLNADLMEYHRNADLTDEDAVFSVDSRSSLEDEQDEDHLALLASPISVDQTQSPEDLLAHRLSGQCHTSFDLTAWQEASGNPTTTTTTAELPSPAGSMNRTGRIIAHLEEVVFDVPLDQENANRLSPPYSSQTEDDLPVLAVFSPTEEPDLLLVYQIRHVTGAADSTKPSNTIRLFAAIDLTTGERVSLSDNGQRFWESVRPAETSAGSLLLTLDAARLGQLTSRCPHNNPHLGSTRNDRLRANLVHELNNVHMTYRFESLKLLVDPQGGYAVYW